MDGPSAYTFATVVCAECQGMGATGYPEIVPIKFVRARFIADPIFFRIPEGTGFKSDNAKSRAREALDKDTACTSYAHDAIVDRVCVVESPHGRWEGLHRTQPMGH
jgi:hypothetical protein